MNDPSCIFCRIVKGEIPSAKVYEDPYTVAFLDIQPLAPGHVLVVPKAHIPKVQDLPTASADAMWRAVHAVVPRAEKAVGGEATTIAVNNGAAAGQEVAHVHVHVVPRKKGDDGGPIHAAFPKRPTLSKDEMAAIAKRFAT